MPLNYSDIDHDHVLEKRVSELAVIQGLVSQAVQFVRIPLPADKGMGVHGWLFVDDKTRLKQVDLQSLIVELLQAASRQSCTNYSVIDFSIATPSAGGAADRHIHVSVQVAELENAIQYFTRGLGPGVPSKFTFFVYP